MRLSQKQNKQEGKICLKHKSTHLKCSISKIITSFEAGPWESKRCIKCAPLLWLLLAVNMEECRITWEMGLWACLWQISWMGRSTHCGWCHSIARDVWRKNWATASMHSLLCFITVLCCAQLPQVPTAVTSLHGGLQSQLCEEQTLSCLSCFCWQYFSTAITN